MRVYVLSTTLTPAPGKIGDDGKYLYTTSPQDIPDPTWDGTEMELIDDPENPIGDDPTDPVVPCLTDSNERVVFFTKSSDFGNTINCYIWYTKNGTTTQVCGGWPGKKATALGSGNYKFVVPEEAAAIDSDWKIIWNDGSGNQTRDLNYQNHYLYTGANKGAIDATSEVTMLCENLSAVEQVSSGASNHKFLMNGRLYIQVGEHLYDATGQLITTDASGNLPVR